MLVMPTQVLYIQCPLCKAGFDEICFTGTDTIGVLPVEGNRGFVHLARVREMRKRQDEYEADHAMPEPGSQAGTAEYDSYEGA